MVMVSPGMQAVTAASASATTGASSDRKVGNASDVSIRLWPPGPRTRAHVAERMAENLKSLSSFYSPVDADEAARLASQIEELAFEEGQHEAQTTAIGVCSNNGSSAVRVYAKHASKVMLEVLKTGKLPEQAKVHEPISQSDVSGSQKVAVSEEKESTLVTTVVKDDAGEDVEDTASTTDEADTQLFDISGGKRDVLGMEKAEELFQALTNSTSAHTKIRLSNWSFKKEAADVAARVLSGIKDRLIKADLSDIVAGRPEAEALEVMGIFSTALEGSNLSYLDLSNNALGEKGVRAFGSLLKSQKHLKELFFENNGISADAGKAIVELLPSGKELKTLHFHNNMSGDLGAETLSKLVKDAAVLEDFRFSSSRVGSKGAVSLAEALKAGSSLKKLDLRDNMFGPEAGVALGGALKQHLWLTELYLADLGLEDKGVRAVLDALTDSAPNLSVLDLGNNEITTSSAPHIASFLEKKAPLTKLSLAENDLKDKGVILVSNALKQNHDNLQELDFTLNELGSEGAIAAAKAVAMKPHFKLLVLESNHISAKGLETVKEVLASGIGVSVLAPIEDNEEVEDDEEEEEDGDEDEDDDAGNEETGDSEELQNRLDALSM